MDRQEDSQYCRSEVATLAGIRQAYIVPHPRKATTPELGPLGDYACARDESARADSSRNLKSVFPAS